MKRIILIIITALILSIAIFKAQANEACSFYRGYICPIGTYSHGTRLINGEIYSICCVNYYY